jgi:hypothetical protein
LFRLIVRIKSRISGGRLGRPSSPRRTFHVQKNRSPFRCHATTVSGWTITRTVFHSLHNRRSNTQTSRSAPVIFNRLGAERHSTASCRRRATLSSRSSADVLSIQRRAFTTISSRLITDSQNGSSGSNPMMAERSEYFIGTVQLDLRWHASVLHCAAQKRFGGVDPAIPFLGGGGMI